MCLKKQDLKKKTKKKIPHFSSALSSVFHFPLSTYNLDFFRLLVVYSYGALTICTEISVKIFREWNGTGIVFGTENRHGIEVHHLQNIG